LGCLVLANWGIGASPATKIQPKITWECRFEQVLLPN